MKKPSDKVIFADDKTEASYKSLSDSDPLKKGITRAIKEIKENCQAGEHIKPKSPLAENCLKKYGANNIRVYDLPLYYRLIYSIVPSEVKIISLILDYPDHKDYDKLCKKK